MRSGGGGAAPIGDVTEGALLSQPATRLTPPPEPQSRLASKGFRMRPDRWRGIGSVSISRRTCPFSPCGRRWRAAPDEGSHRPVGIGLERCG
jgi:hypothetical protein